MTVNVAGITLPDTQLTREITELVRDTESELLFHHSSRVFYFAALAGQRRGLAYDPELLYCGCMFHDMGLTHRHNSACERFEVDGANAARDFLKDKEFRNRTSMSCGPRSRCTPRPAFRNTCIRSLRWSRRVSRWTSWA